MERSHKTALQDAPRGLSASLPLQNGSLLHGSRREPDMSSLVSNVLNLIDTQRN